MTHFASRTVSVDYASFSGVFPSSILINFSSPVALHFVKSRFEEAQHACTPLEIRPLSIPQSPHGQDRIPILKSEKIMSLIILFNPFRAPGEAREEERARGGERERRGGSSLVCERIINRGDYCRPRGDAPHVYFSFLLTSHLARPFRVPSFALGRRRMPLLPALIFPAPFRFHCYCLNPFLSFIQMNTSMQNKYKYDANTTSHNH